MILRLLDVLGAVVGILLTSPLMIATAIAIKLESSGPVIFAQNRVGRQNRIFRIYKFRSMYVGTPEVAKDQLVGQIDRRVTRIGKFIRRTSIDELPQFFNVLIGDMSLVGPRPALYNQHDLIQMRTDAGVHRLRPGLTGLAQVSGREDMDLQTKVEYDQRLLETLNPVTYLMLVLRTFAVLFRARGTY